MNNQAPIIPAEQTLPEITVKAVVIAVIITAILAASNAYLALKMGNTIAASIPAAVAAMGILRLFRKRNVLETNIIQTSASAGEAVAAIVAFMMPIFIISGDWKNFSYGQILAYTLVGGGLGVIFSVPLRRVMLKFEGLPFPEGTAIGNVLRSQASGTAEMHALFSGLGAGALVSFLQSGLQVLSDSVQYWTKTAAGTVYGFGAGFSPAMLAAGYIVGPVVAASMAVGLVLGWLIGVPLSSMLQHTTAADGYQAMLAIKAHTMRYVGIGVMIFGGVWTMLRLLKPLIKGLVHLTQTTKQQHNNGRNVVARTERDMPFSVIIWGLIICAVLSGAIFVYEIRQEHLHLPMAILISLTIFAVLYIIFMGFITSTICGYFTGLLGSTNNPISGLLIGTVLLLSLIVLGVYSLFEIQITTQKQTLQAMVMVISITTIVAMAAAMANENLQDLKAGQMVGATPWKQQTMLFIGVIVSALVAQPVMDLLFNAYGIGGIMPHPGMDPSQMLAAPQAVMISTLTNAVFSHHVPWLILGIGGLIAIFCIIVDELLRKRGLALPVLGVGVAIYLPPEVTVPIVLGGLIHLVTKRKINWRMPNQKSILLACGLVAGAALMGVLLAIPFVIKGSANALAIVPSSFAPFADILSVLVTIGLCYWLYRYGVALLNNEVGHEI